MKQQQDFFFLWVGRWFSFDNKSSNCYISILLLKFPPFFRLFPGNDKKFLMKAREAFPLIWTIWKKANEISSQLIPQIHKAKNLGEFHKIFKSINLPNTKSKSNSSTITFNWLRPEAGKLNKLMTIVRRTE